MSFLLLLIPFALLGAAYRTLPLQIGSTAHIRHASSANRSEIAIHCLSSPAHEPDSRLHSCADAVICPAFSNLERRASYSRMFATLLFAIGLKSLFEALEFTVMGEDGTFTRVQYWLGLCTFLCVLGGLGPALWHGRQVHLPWTELRLRRMQKFALAGLFGLYLLIVTESLSLSYRVTTVA